MFSRAAAVLAIVIAAVIAAYAINVGAGMRAAAQTSGTLAVRGLQAPVQIVRDDRDIPHISARNLSDLYFAEGFAQGSDRLFQMDLIRRYVTGNLAEVMGPAALEADENARIVPVDRIVQAEWEHLRPGDRAALQSFSDGVNEAMRTQPLPAEFRILMYKPHPWRPQDSLASSFSIVLDLIDRWDDVVRRDEVARKYGTRIQQDLYSITDPQYDAPVTGAPAPVALLGRGQFGSARAKAAALYPENDWRQASNNFALGANRSVSHHALLANDPHLRLGIPGVWYLAELQAPGLHVAGATLAGIPGIILGHNDRIAWGATNGTVVSEVVYRDDMRSARKRRETFHVRFGEDAQKTYLQSQHGFVIDEKNGYAVDWKFARLPVSPLHAFASLDRAASVSQAIDALRDYPGPTQNFVIADRAGTAAYHLAGMIPDDPSWGMRVHRASDPFYKFLPFDALPHVDASRTARVFTANNRMYGRGYPYRLSSNFAAPYRAYRIEQLLAEKPQVSVDDLFAIQSDTLSLPESELARDVLAAVQRKHLDSDKTLDAYLQALQSWDGRFDPASSAASLMYAYRRRVLADFTAQLGGKTESGYRASAQNADIIVLLRILRERPDGWCPKNDCDGMLVSSLQALVDEHGSSLLQPWSQAGSVAVKHPLAALGISILNGGTLSGDGDAFSPHVLTNAPHSQSFRAVWDTGDWNAGGIIIPSGESGEPGSRHYVDLRRTWEEQRLVPLPFGDPAVRRAGRSRLALVPS